MGAIWFIFGAAAGMGLTLAGIWLGTWMVKRYTPPETGRRGMAPGGDFAAARTAGMSGGAASPITYPDALRAAQMANFWTYDGGQQKRAEEIAGERLHASSAEKDRAAKPMPTARGAREN